MQISSFAVDQKLVDASRSSSKAARRWQEDHLFQTFSSTTSCLRWTSKPKENENLLLSSSSLLSVCDRFQILLLMVRRIVDEILR